MSGATSAITASLVSISSWVGAAVGTGDPDRKLFRSGGHGGDASKAQCGNTQAAAAVPNGLSWTLLVANGRESNSRQTTSASPCEAKTVSNPEQLSSVDINGPRGPSRSTRAPAPPCRRPRRSLAARLPPAGYIPACAASRAPVLRSGVPGGSCSTASAGAHTPEVKITTAVVIQPSTSLYIPLWNCYRGRGLPSAFRTWEHSMVERVAISLFLHTLPCALAPARRSRPGYTPGRCDRYPDGIRAGRVLSRGARRAPLDAGPHRLSTASYPDVTLCLIGRGLSPRVRGARER